MWFISDEWLSEAGIAAIVLGVLLLIFIIIVIVLAILLCKKQRSHNFQHSSSH
jgi:preprotein translocase subunit SecG